MRQDEGTATVREGEMAQTRLMVSALIWILASSAAPGTAAAASGLRDEAPPIPVEEIIREFAAREAEFRRARENYTYRQSVNIEVLTLAGGKTGQRYYTLSDILFDNRGRRIEKVLRAPQSTLRNIQFTQEDLDDIQNIFPFVLTTADIGKYGLTYLGKELIDEIDTYVFEVIPKVIRGKERYFEGKIWVDDQELQIVKTDGKTVYRITRKNRDQRFPRFETYRQMVDGRYWFPVYTKADDVLDFPGQRIRIREIVTYKNYKRFEADVKITVSDEVPEKKDE